MDSTPRFLTGVFAFAGAGLDAPVPVANVSYTVPGDRRAQPIYFRGGNSADGLVAVVLLRDGRPMRTFPIGAKAAMHVPLAVVEDLMPDSVVTVAVAAPAGLDGQLVLDIGLIEI